MHTYKYELILVYKYFKLLRGTIHRKIKNIKNIHKSKRQQKKH